MKVRRGLQVRAPYDLRLICRGYVFPPWRFQGGSAVRALVTPSGQVVEAQVCQSGSVEHPEIQVWLRCSGKLGSQEISALCAQIDWALGLTEDLSAFHRVARNDPELSRAIRELKGYRVKVTGDLHEMLVSAVVSQNTSFRAFRQMLMAVVEKFGPSVLLDDRKVCAFPAAEILARASPEELRAAGAYRAQAIHNVSRALLDGLEKQIEDLSAHEAAKRLMAVKGLGPYSAHAALLYGLRRYDAFFTDTYVLKVLGNLFFRGKKPTEARVRDFAARRWGAWQGLALDLLLAWQMGDREL